MRVLNRKGALQLAAALALAGVAAPVVAATNQKAPGSDVVYRCRDARGQSHFGQAIPAPCMESDVEVLDGTGRVVRVIPGRRTLEQAAAQKDAAEQAKAREQRDRTLLATYLSVADIERLRDQRLDLLEQQSRVTRQYIENLREREARLVQSVQQFRPYARAEAAPPLPDHLAEEIVNTVNGLQVYQQELAKNTTEQDRLRAEFNADIARFRELKGVR